MSMIKACKKQIKKNKKYQIINVQQQFLKTFFCKYNK